MAAGGPAHRATLLQTPARNDVVVSHPLRCHSEARRAGRGIPMIPRGPTARPWRTVSRWCGGFLARPRRSLPRAKSVGSGSLGMTWLWG